ncbi:MAG: glycosyltransferase family 2 protein [Candidatus Omnitrophica bacterium]|nr:glycosyltransferase family 2 protein [Candidatus Omnitrophota bacterium]
MEGRDGKLPVSVVIITWNEESRIRECLRSVQWAQECIVVDDESTDRTREICEEEGAKVFVRKMEIEGVHRNWAYAKASQPWVLSLDADERVTPGLYEEFKQLLAGNPEFNGYTMPRRNFIGKRWLKHGGWYPSAQLRFFRKGEFQYEEVSVHPRAIFDQAWGNLKNDLLHYSYRDVGDFLGKLNRQTDLEARKWAEDGRKMSLGRAIRKTLDRFFRAYLMKKGYRDGFMGFVAAVFGGLYQFVTYAKYREIMAGREGASV